MFVSLVCYSTVQAAVKWIQLNKNSILGDKCLCVALFVTQVNNLRIPVNGVKFLQLCHFLFSPE